LARKAKAYLRIGNALHRAGRFDEAAAAYRRSIAADPDRAKAHSNLAATLLRQERIAEALAAASQAIAIRPDLALAHLNLGNALRRAGRLDEAVAACRRAVAIDPDLAEAHFDLSLALLAAGRLEDGWHEYEWRLRGGSEEHRPARFKAPRWWGEGLAGKRLLVHAEQGLGDTLQYARFVPLLAERGKVRLAVQRPLVGLLRLAQWKGVEIAHRAGRSGVDFELPLMSAPVCLGTTEATIPRSVPYLSADPARGAAWRRRLPKRGFRVGIVWQGRPDATIDRGRSIPLRCFAALARVPETRLFSLQKNYGLDQLAALPAGIDVTTFGVGFDAGPDAFLDTAAAIMNLDLVVSADTSVAHLAGALGRPVWIALQRAPDSRWLLEREDSPWYPTARLFRQQAAGDWHEVFERMAAELARVVAGERARLLPPAVGGTGGGPAIPVSAGELVDRITILQIREQRLDDPARLANVRRELRLLVGAWRKYRAPAASSERMFNELRGINSRLWCAEDDIRACERTGDFGPRFIALARSIYRYNDDRAALKSRINRTLKSDFNEEKLYRRD
jgi:hypothetical protein